MSAQARKPLAIRSLKERFCLARCLRIACDFVCASNCFAWFCSQA